MPRQRYISPPGPPFMPFPPAPPEPAPRDVMPPRTCLLLSAPFYPAGMAQFEQQGRDWADDNPVAAATMRREAEAAAAAAAEGTVFDESEFFRKLWGEFRGLRATSKGCRRGVPNLGLAQAHVLPEPIQLGDKACNKVLLGRLLNPLPAGKHLLYVKHGIDTDGRTARVVRWHYLCFAQSLFAWL